MQCKNRSRSTDATRPQHSGAPLCGLKTTKALWFCLLHIMQRAVCSLQFLPQENHIPTKHVIQFHYLHVHRKFFMIVNNNAHVDIYKAIACFQSVLLHSLCCFRENQIWNTPQQVINDDYVLVGL
jgi:hypothetical protein